eukprot:5271750-Amphidinium_carterae.2
MWMLLGSTYSSSTLLLVWQGRSRKAFLQRSPSISWDRSKSVSTRFVSHRTSLQEHPFVTLVTFSDFCLKLQGLQVLCVLGNLESSNLGSLRDSTQDANAECLDEGVSKYRQEEEEEHRRVAMSFLSNDAAHRIYTLRAVLASEIDLMQSVLADNSTRWEARQLVTDKRHFRAVDNYMASLRGGRFQQVLVDASARLCTPYLWGHLPQEEAFVNHTYKLMARQAAGIYKLLITRCRTYPGKLLAVLDNPDIGAAIVHDFESYPCLLDSWSREFLSLHPTLESLLAPATLYTLSAVAEELMTNTFNVERTHTKHATRSRYRVTHPIQVSDMAAWNMAESYPPWMQSHMEREKPKYPKA